MPPSPLCQHLLSLVEEASRELPDVAVKRMFGCDALFADSKIYSLIWKTGRIGVKLSTPAWNAELMALDGAEPWSPGPKMKMSSWVLVPESFHDELDQLSVWVERAHQDALAVAANARSKHKPKPKPKPKAQRARSR